MKIIIGAIVAICLAACASVQIETTTKSTTCKANATAVFMGAEQVSMAACHGSLNADKPAVDPIVGTLLDALLKKADIK